MIKSKRRTNHGGSSSIGGSCGGGGLNYDEEMVTSTVGVG
jgi:hypothetical protein